MNCWREVPREGPGYPAASNPLVFPWVDEGLSSDRSKMEVNLYSFLTVFSDTLSQLLGAGVFQKSLLSHAWDLSHVSVTQRLAVDSSSPRLSVVRELAIHMNCVPATSLAEFYFRI